MHRGREPHVPWPATSRARRRADDRDPGADLPQKIQASTASTQILPHRQAAPAGPSGVPTPVPSSPARQPIRETLFLGRADVRRLLPMDTAMQVVEAAFASHGRGEVRMPAKLYLDLPEFHGDLRAMPAFIPSLNAAGVKWVSSYPRNPGRGLPSVIAVLVLSDPETAEPLAVMDGTYLTLMRTGAAGGIAARYLSRPTSAVLALVGAGAQSHAQLEAIRLVRPIRAVRIFDPSEAAVSSFLSAFTGRGLEILSCPSARRCVEGADIIVTTTPSRQPIVDREWVAAGTHVNALGADAAGKQELDEQILIDGRVFIDDRDQAFHSGEVNVPLACGHIWAGDITGTLGEVVAGLIDGRRADDEITVFDSTGLAVQDIAVARAVYDIAIAQGAGRLLPLSDE